jgi:hypothetical protein
MTKYPRDKTDKDFGETDENLMKVIETTRVAIEKTGFIPRIAAGNLFQPMLWDNVELHLLACGLGVAIVEDRYRKELNPNVAMEWGWMRAMGKPVLYLMEQTFSSPRADIDGFVNHQFHWDHPNDSITQHVGDWLSKLKVG